MSKLSSIIIDDERLARVSLRNKLRSFPEIDLVGEASSVETAIKAIEDLQPDLIFLDIQMLDGTGFDLLERVEYSGKIIFVTAFNEHAIRAFEVNALDYLLKPVSVARLKSVIPKIFSNESKESYSKIQRFSFDDRMMVENKGQIHFIFVSDIVKITSAKDYSIIHTTDHKTFCVLCSMTDWEMKLPDKHFFRAHRSSIINFNQIEKTIKVGSTAEVYLKGMNEAIRISRGYYKTLRDKYLYK